MKHGPVEPFDVIVIGGGPAGSTAASLIAMQGGKVLLLEADRLPRHQIGESLLPATVHGVCRLLGLTDELARAGFVKKRGGTFRWGKGGEPWTFKFARDSDAPGGFAYQVDRARFDKLLLDNSRRQGVDVREGHAVQEILFADDRACGVRFTDDKGFDRSAQARYIVDAGGHRSRSCNPHVGKRVHSKLFQNVALYTYFEGGKRLPAPNSGNILCCAFRDGWFWYIPLSDTLTSVGAVVSREAAKVIQEGNEEAFKRLVSDCPLIADYLSNATRVTTGMYGHYRVRTDYSYCNTVFWRPGIVLIGDAACFIDPIFSSGVHLATYSALLAARSINTCLSNPTAEAECFREFEMRYRREYGNFYQFCSAFYDMDQSVDSYFWAARRIIKTEERDNEAFVRLVAGLSREDEPAFSASGWFEARAGLGVWMEDMMSKYQLAEGLEKPDRPVPEFDKSKFDPAVFMRGFTSEITQVQILAMYGAERPADEPVVTGGLIPSADGMQWALASA